MHKLANVLYLGLYYLLNMISYLPLCFLKALSKALAFCFLLFSKKLKKIVRANLEVAYKDLSEKERKLLLRRVFARYALYAFLYARLQRASRETVLSLVQFKNEEIVHELLENKEKFAVFTAHFGFWELISPAFSLHFKQKIAVVGKPLKHELINKRLDKNRKRFGIDLIAAKGGLKHMLRMIKEGVVLGVLTDQDALLNESEELEMYGLKVSQTKGLSLMCFYEKAALLPVFIYMQDEKFVIEFLKAFKFNESFSKEENIRASCAYQLECVVRMQQEHRDEYFWFHKRFKRFHPEIYE